jgi:hypothetical protein
MGTATAGHPTGQNQGDNPETPIVERESEGPAQDIEEGKRDPQQLFRYSSWVHIGPGAEDCKEGTEGTCTDFMHFHAWCRLPNQLQHGEIQEKALAAKARRIRQFRDPDSDAHAALEGELDELARLGDTAKSAIIEEIVKRDWWRDLLQAQRELAEEVIEGTDDKKYAHIEDDQERFAELERKAQAEERDPSGDEEYRELQKHLQDYADRLEARHTEIAAPKKEALEGRDLNALLDTLREDRINAYSGETLMQTYSEYEWFYGTLVKPPYGERRFKSREQMLSAAPEVIDALRETFEDLEREQQVGNS